MEEVFMMGFYTIHCVDSARNSRHFETFSSKVLSIRCTSRSFYQGLSSRFGLAVHVESYLESNQKGNSRILPSPSLSPTTWTRVQEPTSVQLLAEVSGV